MYYRIEAQELLKNGRTGWYGIGQVLCGSENRKAFRGLSVPKCLKTGRYRNTRSWFTDYGWRKYYPQIMKQVDSHNYWIPTRIRILRAENLPNLVMCGKTQVVENLDPKDL